MKKYKLYSLNDDSGVRYVGITTQTLSARLSNHISSCKQAFKNKRNMHHRHCWIKSLLDKGQVPTIHLIKSFQTQSALKKAEIITIESYKKRGYKLVNLTKGGDGIRNYKFTKEQLLKLRHKVDQYTKDGIFIKTFNSKKEAAISIGKSDGDGKICQVTKGSYGKRTAYGYVWRNHGDPFDLYPITFQGSWSKERRLSMRNKQLINNNMKGKFGILNGNSKPVIIIHNHIIIDIVEGVKYVNIGYGKSFVTKMLKTNKTIDNYQLVYANKDIVRSLQKCKSSTLKTFVGQKYNLEEGFSD